MQAGATRNDCSYDWLRGVSCCAIRRCIPKKRGKEKNRENVDVLFRTFASCSIAMGNV